MNQPDQHSTEPDLRSRIVAALASGVWSPLVIAEELGCPVEAVHEVIANPGYGIQPVRIHRPGAGAGAVNQ